MIRQCLFQIVQEAFFTEVPPISFEYFQNSAQWVGWYYLISTVYTLPISLGTAYISKKVDDKIILLIGFVFYLVGCSLKINY